MRNKIKRLAGSNSWLALASAILIIFGSWFVLPNWIMGDFIEPVTVEGWRAPDGEIYVADTRLVHRDATPGHYFVKVHRLEPQPATLICDGDGVAFYHATEDLESITLDLGYYMGHRPGSGREQCPRAYEGAEIIGLQVTWCERHFMGLCLGRVDLPTMAVIDLRG